MTINAELAEVQKNINNVLHGRAPHCVDVLEEIHKLRIPSEQLPPIKRFCNEDL